MNPIEMIVALSLAVGFLAVCLGLWAARRARSDVRHEVWRHRATGIVLTPEVRQAFLWLARDVYERRVGSELAQALEHYERSQHGRLRANNRFFRGSR